MRAALVGADGNLAGARRVEVGLDGPYPPQRWRMPIREPLRAVLAEQPAACDLPRYEEWELSAVLPFDPDDAGNVDRLLALKYFQPLAIYRPAPAPRHISCATYREGTLAIEPGVNGCLKARILRAWPADQRLPDALGLEGGKTLWALTDGFGAEVPVSGLTADELVPAVEALAAAMACRDGEVPG